MKPMIDAEEDDEPAQENVSSAQTAARNSVLDVSAVGITSPASTVGGSASSATRDTTALPPTRVG